ncbi:MAG: ACP S-malonyltransferase [Desulfobacterales bacterium]|nr:ACP S-malonyltransferase [Desulfobacterales bacterium]MBF0398652.1 ACP S-malonyltransferase [Desulfobacterales bacterium]
MSIVFIFPGQGEQKVGMGKDIYDAYPDKRYVFDNANEILNENFKDICFEGTYDDLVDSRKSGIAVFLVSALIYEIMKEASIKPSGYAGYSLGQYSALYAAGSFPYDETLSLVNFRGKCLKAASMEKETGMMGVIGLPEKIVEEIVQGVGNAYIANYNSPGNYSISYAKSIKDILFSEFKKADAMKVVDIPVAGGWHSPFMKSAADMFRPELLRQTIIMPNGDFVENFTAKQVTSVEQLKDNLYYHIYGPVRWYQSVRKLIEMGKTTFVEIGFGNQLSKFIKFTSRKVNVFSTGSIREIEQTISSLSKELS